MICCNKCFKDSEIIDIIGDRKKGECDFCGSSNVSICDFSNNNSIKENFETLLDAYTPFNKDTDMTLLDQADYLVNILYSEWHIFNIKQSEIRKFLIELFPDKHKENRKLFDSKVIISGLNDENFLEQYSILTKSSWEDFVKEIKTENRFHTNIINKSILEDILNVSTKEYFRDHEFYRARIWFGESGFDEKNMGAPPKDKAIAGRANSEGISYLYLANSEKTTLHETRAGLYDRATVGKFTLNEDIKIVNLSDMDKISPFRMDTLDLLPVNLVHLKKITSEISRPLRKNDSRLDYLPTQYICDFIKSIGFDGIQYSSTMCSDGVNIVVFDEKKLTCIEVKNYDIGEINYNFKPIEI